jgi:16S rRNA (guanine(966)-N(2))-methyltransferase RsmD
MRIIAGEFRSRRLLSPPRGAAARPIPDRVKESLFSILRGNVEGATVLDCFAGTGAIGLEALSRGAARCLFVERDQRMADVLRRNIEALGCEDRAEVVVGEALGIGILARAPRPIDLLFFDPPYELIRQPAGWARVRDQFARLIELLADSGFAVLRTPWPFVHADEPAPPRPPVRHAAPGRPHTRAARPDHHDEDDDQSLDDDLALEAETSAEGPEAAPTPPAKTRRHAVDLRVPGAVGPETHTYRHTALHFYMRRR